MPEKIYTFGSIYGDVYLVRLPIEVSAKYGFNKIEELVLDLQDNKIIIYKKSTTTATKK